MPSTSMRTMREFENAGVAAVILEDQVVAEALPDLRRRRSRCIPMEEDVAKIQAAVAARARTRTC